MLVKCQMCQGTGKVPCECSLMRDDADCRQGTEAENCRELIPEAVSSSIGETSLIEEETAERPGMLRETPCSACGGSGMVQCLGCLGTGYVDMPCFA